MARLRAMSYGRSAEWNEEETSSFCLLFPSRDAPTAARRRLLRSCGPSISKGHVHLGRPLRQRLSEDLSKGSPKVRGNLGFNDALSRESREVDFDARHLRGTRPRRETNNSRASARGYPRIPRPVS